MSEANQTVELLSRIEAGVFRSAGNSSDVDELFTLVYNELRKIARRQRGGNPRSPSFSTTDLVHDAYLKLVGYEKISEVSRKHFLAISAKAMRQVLVDRARAQSAKKRGGDYIRWPMEDDLLGTQQDRGVLELNACIEELSELNPVHADLVELRFFGGMTAEEVSQVVGRSRRWVEDQWPVIRAWLRSRLTDS